MFPIKKKSKINVSAIYENNYSRGPICYLELQNSERPEIWKGKNF